MRTDEIDAAARRDPRPGTDRMFPARWSPRAMSGEEISEDELLDLLEAARWAPSSFNEQPWRIVYALRGTAVFDSFLDLLVPGNRAWAKDAAALLVFVSRSTFSRNGKPSRTHAFDTGAAWMSVALQGSRAGLVVHGMAGFDYDRAAEALAVPEDHAVQAMAAVGRPGEIEDLSEELRKRETPSGRKPLSEIALPGRFDS